MRTGTFCPPRSKPPTVQDMSCPRSTASTESRRNLLARIGFSVGCPCPAREGPVPSEGKGHTLESCRVRHDLARYPRRELAPADFMAPAAVDFTTFLSGNAEPAGRPTHPGGSGSLYSSDVRPPRSAG